MVRSIPPERLHPSNASASSSSSTADVPARPAQAHSESMLRRLAGQSVNKAGLQRDPEEVNRIIAQASVGSSFYENERKKDEELGKKIEKLLARRDDLLLTADMDRLGKITDDIIEQIETTRDNSQSIVHVDLDAFYANVELLTDPSLKDIAFGVGEGVLTTASYEARKYGARSGMPGFIAKKLCPHIRFVKPHFDEYNKWSHKVMAVFRPYAKGKMSIAGVDEAYLNITEYMNEHQLSAEEVVLKLRTECFEKTGLTVSAGIAPTKMLAKICSDRRKPNGQFTCPSDREGLIAFTGPLPIRLVPGIGKVTERCLQALGILTCGDIVQKRRELHLLDYGTTALLKASLGCTSNECVPGKKADRKTVGVERTFKSMSKPERLVEEMESIAGELEEHLDSLRFVGRTVVFKFKTDDFKTYTRDKTLTYEVSKKEQIIAVARKLLDKELPLSIRLMGLRVAKLRDLDAVPTGTIDSYFQKSPTKRSSFSSKAARAGSAEAAIVVDGSSDDEDGMKQFRDELEEVEMGLVAAGKSAGVDWEFPATAKEGKAKGKGKQREIVSASPTKRKKSASPVKSSVKGESGSGEREDKEKGVEKLKDAVVCPACDFAFPPKTSNLDINTHLDTCLSAASSASVPSATRAAIYVSSSDEADESQPKLASKKKKVKVEESGTSTAPLTSGKGAKDRGLKGKKAATGKTGGKSLNTFEAMMKARG